MQVYTCEPGIELNGLTASSLLENVNRDFIAPFLDAHGLTEITPDPDAWYSLQAVLDVMNDIALDGSTTGSFVAIGMKAAELSLLTPEMEALPFPQFMHLYADIYQTRHRNGFPGKLVVDAITPQHVMIYCNVPYPDDVMYGLIFGYARRLLSSRGYFTVYYDENTLSRDQGGRETVIHVTWD